MPIKKMIKMNEKDPQNWAMATWALAFGVSMGGALVSWFSRRNRGWKEFLKDVFSSGFVGFIVFMASYSIDWPIGLCAALSGIASHMGPRLLFFVEESGEEHIKRLINKE